MMISLFFLKFKRIKKQTDIQILTLLDPNKKVT